MGSNIFTNRGDSFLRSENTIAEVRLSEHIEPKGGQMNFDILKVLSGDKAVEGEPFWTSNIPNVEEDEIYLAKLRVSWYENMAFPEIECEGISAK